MPVLLEMKLWSFLGLLLLGGWTNAETSINALKEEFQRMLQDAALDVLSQQETDYPPQFNMPKDFMHIFRPNTGVGNREDLVIDSIKEIPVTQNANFVKWRYRRFNNTDYLLGMSTTRVTLWQKSADSDSLSFVTDDSIMNYVETKGMIGDSMMFVRRAYYMDVLYVAILVESGWRSYINIYEINEYRGLMVTVIDIGHNTASVRSQSKLAELQSRNGHSISVLISNTEYTKITHQRRASSALNHYLEVHFPEAVDMISFTINGYAYIAVANGTLCEVYKFDEFVKSHTLFERIYFQSDLIDLEYFRLGVYHYLVTVTTTNQVLYVWKKGGFFETQTIFLSGVQQSYGAYLSNCRDDILLLFIRDNDVPDTFIWNGVKGEFVQVNTDIPQNFVPVPGSTASYAYGTAAVILCVDGGGMTMAFSVLSHMKEIEDPFLIMGKEITDIMNEIQKAVEEQDAAINVVQDVLAHAVRPDGMNHFTAQQSFSKIKTIKGIEADITSATRVAWENSQLSMEDYINGIRDLDARVKQLQKEVSSLEIVALDAVKIDEDAVIGGKKTFLGAVSAPSLTSHNLVVQKAGNVDVTQLMETLYRLDESEMMQGVLTFEKPVTTSDLHVDGTINGIDLSNVMTTNTEQTSYANMVFDRVTMVDVEISGKLNNIDVRSDVVPLHGNTTITGKFFKGGIVAENVVTEYINGINVNDLMSTALTRSTKQTITGNKFLNRIHAKDITLNGFLNGYRIEDLARSVVRIDQEAIITGHTIFKSDTVAQSLTTHGTVNGLRIPDDIFLTDEINTITAEKEFSSVVANTVIGKGTINGLNIPEDIVKLTDDGHISGTIHFLDGISVLSDVIVSGLIDGVNITEMAKTALVPLEDEIRDVVFLDSVTVTGDVSADIVNGVNLHKLLADIVYKNETTVNIYGQKNFKSMSADSIELAGTVNGYDLSRDLMTVDGEQTINGRTIFKKMVTFKDLIADGGVVNDVNLTQLYENRIALSVQDFEDGLIFDTLEVTGNVTIGGTVNGVKIPDGIVRKSAEQRLSNKKFTGTVYVDDLIVDGNINVQETFGNIKLPEYLSEVVTLTEPQSITGDVIIGNISAGEVKILGTVNNIDIESFSNNVMSMTKEQTIGGYKHFSGPVSILGSLETNRGVNGYNLRLLQKEAIKINEDIRVTDLSFADHVTFGNIDCEFINGIDISKLGKDTVKKGETYHIQGESTFVHGFHVEGDILTADVNGLNVEDILTKDGRQTITGAYTFGNLVSDKMDVTGSINGIPVSELQSMIASKDSAVIASDLVFNAPVYIDDTVDVSGLVNGVDLQDLKDMVLVRHGNQTVQGNKILKGNVTIHGDLDVNKINGIDWDYFLRDVVRIDQPHVINEPKTLTSLKVAGDLSITGFAQARLINGIRIEQFIDNAVFINKAANITGKKIFTNAVEVAGNLNANFINGLRLEKDVITLECGESDQVITGQKTFRDLTVHGDIIVEGYVNGYKLADIVTNTLTIDGNQTVTGHKIFHKPLHFMQNVYPATVNNLLLSRDLIKLNTNEDLYGNFTFSELSQVQDLRVTGLINGINLTKLFEDALYKDKEQDVLGSYSIDNAIVKSDVFVSGMVNGINLDEFQSNVTEFWHQRHDDLAVLAEISKGRCELADHLQSFVKNSYYVLDAVVPYQLLPSTGYANFDGVTLTLNEVENPIFSATQSSYSFNPENEAFTYVAKINTMIARKYTYEVAGGMLSIEIGINGGSKVMFKDQWITSVVQTFEDVSVNVDGKEAILALLDRGTSHVYRLKIKESLPFVDYFGNLTIRGVSDIAVFKMKTVYLAAACNFSSATGMSRIYAYKNESWIEVQQIPASASTAVVHFSFHMYHYLAFTNVVPVYETKEPMAIQVYRNTVHNKNLFSLFQKIPFDNGKALETFEFGSSNELHMLMLNDTVSEIALLEGEAGFTGKITLHGKCIHSILPTVINSNLYLILSEKRSAGNAETIIYKGLTQGSVMTSRTLNHC